MTSRPPIHFYDGHWWFYDETWTDRGPYPTELDATVALTDYVRWLDTGDDPGRTENMGGNGCAWSVMFGFALTAAVGILLFGAWLLVKNLLP